MGDKERKAASSRTYRKVIEKLSVVLGQKPVHTRYPSEDFKRLLGDVKKLVDDVRPNHKLSKRELDVIKDLHSVIGGALNPNHKLSKREQKMAKLLHSAIGDALKKAR